MESVLNVVVVSSGQIAGSRSAEVKHARIVRLTEGIYHHVLLDVRRRHSQSLGCRVVIDHRYV